MNLINDLNFVILPGAASELGRQMSTDNKSPGGALTIAEEAVDQLQENEKLVAGWYRAYYLRPYQRRIFRVNLT